ncbi:MAG: DUF1345 domain-containing protein [Aquabacterium sp.]
MPRNRLIRQIRIRPRLFLSVAIGLGLALLLPYVVPTRDMTRLLLGWNAGTWLYLISCGWMMTRSDSVQIRRRAPQQDEGAAVILTLVVIASLASLGAIVAELSNAKDFAGSAKLAHIGLAVVTIIGSWAFTQMMFALHYAHDYYSAVSRGQPGGLIFPETNDPDYIDFLYFSAVIGTSGQTADVSMSSQAMRRVGLVHCVLAFMFNTSLIALMINVASSLL